MPVQFEINPASDGSLNVGGCLPRQSKPAEWFPMASEAIRTIPRSDWGDLIQQRKDQGLSLREQHVKSILDQDGRGSCAAEEAAQAVMTTMAFGGREHVLLNPWPNYYRITGSRDGGSSIDTNWRLAQSAGFIPMDVIDRKNGFRRHPESLWEEHGANYRLQEVYEITSTEEAVSALLQGFVVGYGRSNHAILAVEMYDLKNWIYANSWGQWSNCGIPGFGKDRITNVNWGYGCFAARCTVDAAADSPWREEKENSKVGYPLPSRRHKM